MQPQLVTFRVFLLTNLHNKDEIKPYHFFRMTEQVLHTTHRGGRPTYQKMQIFRKTEDIVESA